MERRTFLRGSAACLALPWLDAMQSALAPARPPLPRCVFVFSPNGMHMGEWRPEGEGRTASLTRTLSPLVPLQQHVTVFSGLAIDGGRAHGDGPGDHARSASSFLTCAHARKTGGADIYVGISVDQAIAAHLGQATPFASLQLGMEQGAAAGICDSGYSCAYSNNVSWRAPEVPVAKEVDPRALFGRLFGDPEQAVDRAAAREARERDRSVLDLVLADAKSLAGKLGAADRQKLEQYLESVRELEGRLQRLDGEEAATPVPASLLASGRSYPERLTLMYDLLVLALATERTRVATLMLGNGGSNRSFPFLEVPEGHHDLSHHGNKPEKLGALAKINRFQVEQFARFLTRLQAEQEGERHLLSQSMIVFGSGLSDGNRHNHDDLPVLLAGGGGGAVEAQGHVRLARETPMANLYVSVMQAMGVATERFADSTAALPIR